MSYPYFVEILLQNKKDQNKTDYVECVNVSNFKHFSACFHADKVCRKLYFRALISLCSDIEKSVIESSSFLCDLRSILAHTCRYHFVRHLSVHQSVCLSSSHFLVSHPASICLSV